MASLNKIMVIGNAGRDADLRYTANGLANARFSVAVNNRRRNQAGEWEDNTEWFNVVVFGDQAERISQYVTKGKQVFVEGRLQTRNWDDDQGVRRTSIEIIAQSVQMIDRRQPDEGGEGGGGGGWQSADRPQRSGGGSGGYSGGAPARGGFGGGRGNQEPPDDIDDLPFE